uniref:Protein kinase domain-containing protein n=1 Tax=viral metagenome TaxID=1070528 RepID=A0A6C0JWE2_9ZZZZ
MMHGYLLKEEVTADVRKGVKDGKTYAIKKVQEWEYAYYEKWIWKEVKNIDIQIWSLMNYEEERLTSYLALPWIHGWNLDQYQKSSNRWKEYSRLVDDLVSGILQLFKHDIVHQDVKPANVMWDNEAMCFKLIDFGLACFRKDEEYWSFGTPIVSSPEMKSLKMKKEWLIPHDIWSIGCTLFTWFCFGFNYNTDDVDFVQYFPDHKQFYMEYFDKCDPHLYSFLMILFQHDPVVRQKLFFKYVDVSNICNVGISCNICNVTPTWFLP